MPISLDERLRDRLYLETNLRSSILEEVYQWLLDNAEGWESFPSPVVAAIFRSLLNNRRVSTEDAD